MEQEYDELVADCLRISNADEGDDDVLDFDELVEYPL